MTELSPYTQHLRDDARAACSDCEWQGLVADCESITDAELRLSVGAPVPAGTCPDCGALAEIIEADKPDWMKPAVPAAPLDLARQLLAAFPDEVLKPTTRLGRDRAALLNQAVLMAKAVVAGAPPPPSYVAPPDLLEALKALRGTLLRHRHAEDYPQQTREELAAADAAIAKAEGRANG